ncbi:HAD family hydrolase [Robertkochia flava]|uniref:HAD family hydrolase n=1 Tax=Robertkochia flava TaxID=3447986 RepID=UPI001CCD8BB0|nr:HAD family phosphatase [Robertkochia marina]
MTPNIKNIIFDFGDIFINLDKEAPLRGITRVAPGFMPDPEIDRINKLYEKGKITTEVFVDHYRSKLPGSSEQELIRIWNSIILDLPEQRIAFLEHLKNNHSYRLFLLSNTNALHMQQVLLNTGRPVFERFRSLFEKFYLSHEIGMRKPDEEIYRFVLDQNNLQAGETLFIDDLHENTNAAAKIGIHTWTLEPGKEDITQLFSKDLPL